MLKVAVTDFAALIVTVQEVPAALSQPDQPAKIELAAGAAVSVIDVPLLKDAEQVAPQLMPEGDEVTVPVPAPVLLTVREKVWRLKVAVADGKGESKREGTSLVGGGAGRGQARAGDAGAKIEAQENRDVEAAGAGPSPSARIGGFGEGSHQACR